MNIKIGDRVAFNRNDAENMQPLAWGIDFINHLEFKDCKFHKGTITKIKTHNWFFFKIEHPIYVIDDYYMTCSVKPIKREYASLREVINKGTELESVWEFHLN